MAEGELKSCPFCNSAMQFRKALFPNDGCTDAVIHAGPSDCGLTQFDIGTIDDGASVIAAWNRRALSPPAGGDGGVAPLASLTLAADPGASKMDGETS